MEDQLRIEHLLSYLKILQDGRCIPDKKGEAGTVRESSHSIEEIKRITIKLNELLSL